MDQTDEKSTPALLEMLACRVCLVTSGKMFCIETCGLKQAFLDITGTQVSVSDGLPQHICYICSALLKKAVEFRNKCHSTQSLLSNLPLTLDLMKQINLLHGKPFKRTNIVHVSVGEELENYLHDSNSRYEEKNENSETDSNVEDLENDFTDKKLENDFTDKKLEKDFTDKKLEKYLNAEGTVNDLNDFVESTIKNDFNNYEQSPVLNQQTDLRNKDEVANFKKITNPNRFNRDVADKDVTQYILNDPTADPLTKMFYKYIENKYLEKFLKEISTTDEDKPLSKLTVSARNNSLIISNFNPKVNKFYDYLRDCYGYIDADRDSAAKRLLDDAFDNYMDNSEIETRGNEILSQLDIKYAKEYAKYNFNVLIYSKEEQIRYMQERMESDRYKRSQYKCEDCYAGFQYEHKYFNHRARHDTALSGDQECEVCKLKFRSRRRLLSHMYKSHKYKFVCKQCGKQFSSKLYCIEHYEKHNGGATHQCPHCPRVFKKRVPYADHVRTRHGNVFCDICHAVLTPRGVPQHMKLQHPKTFICENCKKVFNDSTALEKHIKTSTNEVCDPNDWSCARCGDNFSSEILLTEHIQVYHRPAPGQRRKTLPSEQRKFKRKPVVNKGKSFMCEWCARICQSIGHLKMHVRVHTGEKPYQCATCPKRFRVKEQLQYHTRTHTGERPHKCPDCPKAFYSQANLLRHQLTHSKLRPYACPICKKTYQQSPYLKVHIRTAHMNIPLPPRIRKRRIQKHKEDDRRVVDDKEDGNKDHERRQVELEDNKRYKKLEKNKNEKVDGYKEEKIEDFEEGITEDSEQEMVESFEDETQVALEEDITKGYEEEAVETSDEEKIEDCEDERIEFLEDWEEYGDEVIVDQCDDHNLSG